MQKLSFIEPRVRSDLRIGPHSEEFLSILFGSLLGDLSLEKEGPLAPSPRSAGGYAPSAGSGGKIESVKLAFYQEKSNGEYLLYLHSKLSRLGYCNSKIPQISSRKKPDGTLRYYYRFKTYSYTSLNWVYDLFYKTSVLNGETYRRKVVPKEVKRFLTPLALAVWFMDDGTCYKNKGVRFSTNCFTLDEVKFLGEVLSEKYGLTYSIHKTGVVNQYSLYLPKTNLSNLKTLLLPHMHPSMYYKLGMWESPLF